MVQLNEHNRMMVSLFGYVGDHPSSNEQEFNEFAKSLPSQDIYETIKNASPISDIKVYRFPMMVRHHYDKMKHFPDGLIVLGDAFCRFDPVFGQGMTVSALENLALKTALDKEFIRGNFTLQGFSKRYQKKISKIIDLPWFVVKSEVFRYRQIEGKRTVSVKLLQWYTKKIFELSASDEKVYSTFIRVMNFVSHPISLFGPSILFRVLIKSFK